MAAAGRRTYEALRAEFRWQIPERFNIATATLGRHARTRPAATALIVEDEGGVVRPWTFRELDHLANRLANTFAAQGLGRGDRVAILLSQGPETAVAHVAAYRAGLIAVPLFVLFGPDALEFRLADSGAALVVTDEANWPKVAEIRDRLPDLRGAIVVGGRGVDGTLDFDAATAAASARFGAVDTAADDPAIIIYTSGTTGPPKGALHAHRFLLGHLPGVLLPQEFPPRPATSSGRRPTGPGSAASTTCSSRPGPGACRSWPIAAGGSTLSARSTCWRATACATCSCPRPR